MELELQVFGCLVCDSGVHTSKALSGTHVAPIVTHDRLQFSVLAWGAIARSKRGERCSNMLRLRTEKRTGLG